MRAPSCRQSRWGEPSAAISSLSASIASTSTRSPASAAIFDPGDLGGEADAARAMDAAIHAGLDQRPEILVLDRALVLLEAAAIEAIGHRLVLQVALAALIADRAVERVVDEQELHHSL